MTRAVTLICGPPCAGKTTYAQQHAQPGDHILDRDTITAANAEQIMRQRIDDIAAMTDGQAWVIRSAPNGTTRLRLATRLRAHVVLLIPPPDVLHQRAIHRPNRVAAIAGIADWHKRYTPTPDALPQPAPRQPRSRHRAGRPWRRAKQQMHAVYGYTCWICGHDEAREADHLDPLANDPDQPIDWRTMRPAHGSNSPCPVCPGRAGKGRACNQERGTKHVNTVFKPVLIR